MTNSGTSCTGGVCRALALLLVLLIAGGCARLADTAEESRRVDELFASFTTGVQPGVAVLVVKDGQVVHRAGYGYADIERKVPITPRSAFRLASVSKQFTAAAVTLLAADGVLSYDDPVSRFLPDLAPYEGVTVRHLMTHTGGLPEYYDIIDTEGRRPTNADAVALLGQMRRALFPPGTRYQYSNPGYDVLAPLVEAASGMTFAAFMRERIFLPLGMEGARIYDHTGPHVPERAFGYRPEGGGFVADDDHSLNGIVGSGGTYASLEDFVQWDRALYGGSLFSSETLREAFAPYVLENGESTDYGFGWRTDEYRGRQRLRHGGSWVGFRTHIARYPDERLSIVLLANRADFEPEAWIDRVTDIWLGSGMIVERDVRIPMRDGVLLAADIYRPAGEGPFPVLVYRTPYGKDSAAEAYGTHRAAVAGGYAVLLQDVRGRYASGGDFEPYRQEGRDGYDTIEWAARQSWSNGDVGTFGLSYPGAVQWLAALESPPGLKAMAPAMTFSSPRRFFYTNGVFDLSWLPWIYLNVAPDRRLRLGLPGARTGAEARETWPEVADRYRSYLPLAELPYLRKEAPFYFEWLQHPPEDPWWDWAELAGRYGEVGAAVLNLSGWHDDSYGIEGAVTNFMELQRARGAGADGQVHLVVGPWTHGVASTGAARAGELELAEAAAIDYDELLLDFFDRYLARPAGPDFGPAVRYFVMGEETWRESDTWPPGETADEVLYLGGDNEPSLAASAPPPPAVSRFSADPRSPVRDPHDGFGARDYAALSGRPDVLIFDRAVLDEPLTIAGATRAIIHASCNCRDFDLWARLLHVRPDGRAMSLMSPGNDLVRASYREPAAGPQPVEEGTVYELRFPYLLTGVRLEKGDSLRLQLSASFAPHFAPNLQTGASEISSAEARPATITIHHDENHPSRLILPRIPDARASR